jgi:hypothetical protein
MVDSRNLAAQHSNGAVAPDGLYDHVATARGSFGPLDRHLYGRDTVMTRRRFLFGYLAATFTLWCVMMVSQFCYEWQNAHQIPDMRLRDVCIEIWSVSSFGVILLQLACIAMMAFPPRLVRHDLTTRIRIAVASFAVIVLLTNPWTVILFVVMRGGTLG